VGVALLLEQGAGLFEGGDDRAVGVFEHVSSPANGSASAVRVAAASHQGKSTGKVVLSAGVEIIHECVARGRVLDQAVPLRW